MNPELLLAHFDRISDEPDAIPHLRRFILELAVRGKLAQQDPRDEPASTLLKRVQEQRARLLREGVLRREKPLLPQTTRSIPFNTPTNWEWARVRETSTLITKGSTPTSYGHAFQSSGVNFIKVEAIRNGQLLPENVTSFISEETNAFLGRSCLVAGDILFSIAGSIGTCARVSENILPANTNQALAIIRGTETVFDPEFVLFCIRSSVSTLILSKARGGAMNNISLGDVGNFLLPVPPLAEQHRIVAKVEELMALCDRLEAEQREREVRRDRLVAASHYHLNNGADAESFRRHANFYLSSLPQLAKRPDQIKQLRQTILNLAVRGQLVSQDPNDEPASELLKRIQAERLRLVKEGKIRKQQPLPSLSPEEVPFQGPEHWKWLRLGEIGFTQTGTTPSSNNPECFGSYIPFVKPADLSGNTTNYSGAGLSKQGVEHSRLVSKNSALMVCIGSSIGKVNVTDRDICCNQQINAVTPYLEGLTTFTSFALKADYFQKLVFANAGMGTLPIISKGKWEILPVPLPPLPEQHRIAAKVDELMSVCNHLESQLATAQYESRRLLEAVLHESLAAVGG